MRQSPGSVPPLVVRFAQHERNLPAGPEYQVGRDPKGDVVITDARVSRRHAVLRLEEGTWVLADDGSANGTFVEGRRVSRVEIKGKCQVVLGHPVCGAALNCTLAVNTESREQAAHRMVVAQMPVVASRRAERRLRPVPVVAVPQRQVLAPTILTNAAGQDTVSANVRASRELDAQGLRRTRYLDIRLVPGTAYRTCDRLGICPKNDVEQVEQLARHLGAAPDGLLIAPTKTALDVSAGIVLQVRNVLTNLVDIGARPTAPLVDLLLTKVTDPDEWSALAEIRRALEAPDDGGHDVLRLLDEFPSCSLNIFDFLQVAQPLRPCYYSPCSNHPTHGDHVAYLTVGPVGAPAPGTPDRRFCGPSSRYLQTVRRGGELNVFFDSVAAAA